MIKIIVVLEGVLHNKKTGCEERTYRASTEGQPDARFGVSMRTGDDTSDHERIVETLAMEEWFPDGN